MREKEPKKEKKKLSAVQQEGWRAGGILCW
jgi:hypothetical protein